MKDDLNFLRLWDLYSPLLTKNQREITDLYFNYDLSLGEIAEQKGVSRQSVSDCLGKCRKQLEEYEKKLCFIKALDDLSREYSAYMTAVGRWLSTMKEKNSELAGDFLALEKKLDEIHEQFGAETAEVEGGVVVGKTIREEKE